MGLVLAAAERAYADRSFGRDVSQPALEVARGRTTASLYRCALDEVPLGELRGVGLFDVIEHLRDDAAGLTTAARYLRPGGVLLVTVPAHRSLWSQHDELASHFRRYGRRALLDRLSAAGLRVEICRPFFGALLPGVLLRRLARRRDSEATARRFLSVPAPPLNLLLRGIAECDAALCRWGLSPFGTSWLAVARKGEARVRFC